MRAYIGLGANLGDPLAQVQQGILALDTLPATRRIATSPLYRSPPLGPPAQPHYINAVAALDTALPPEALLDHLQAIETRHGRTRTGERWGPRTLDLDLLIYGEQRLTGPRLTVPHPGLAERAFVLRPLYDIAPQLTVPGLGPLAELVNRAPD